MPRYYEPCSITLLMAPLRRVDRTPRRWCLRPYKATALRARLVIPSNHSIRRNNNSSSSNSRRSLLLRHLIRPTCPLITNTATILTHIQAIRRCLPTIRRRALHTTILMTITRPAGVGSSTTVLVDARPSCTRCPPPVWRCRLGL